MPPLPNWPSAHSPYSQWHQNGHAPPRAGSLGHGFAARSDVTEGLRTLVEGPAYHRIEPRSTLHVDAWYLRAAAPTSTTIPDIRSVMPDRDPQFRAPGACVRCWRGGAVLDRDQTGAGGGSLGHADLLPRRTQLGRLSRRAISRGCGSHVKAGESAALAWLPSGLMRAEADLSRALVRS